MTKKEKKQLKEIINHIENIQADVSLAIMQEQGRLDDIGCSPSQFDRALKLEDNIDNLENAETSLGEAITALEKIVE